MDFQIFEMNLILFRFVVSFWKFDKFLNLIRILIGIIVGCCEHGNYHVIDPLWVSVPLLGANASKGAII
jgi:hypothetical protein